VTAATFDAAAVDAFQMTGQDVPWLLNHWAANKPDHPFLIWEPRDGTDRTWTYGAFVAEAKNIAAGLADRGVVKGDKVLVHTDNCPEMVLSWFACALLGAVAVTTNTKSAGPEVEYFAAHTRCVAAITQPQYVELVAANAGAVKWIAVTADDSGEAPEPAEPSGIGAERFPFAELTGNGAALPERPAEPMLPVGIMFTSGTTSRPKAVVHTHANVIWASRVGPDNIKIGPDDRYMIYLPYFHVNAQSWSTWSALGVGASIVLTPKFSVSKFWDVVTKHDVTHFSFMPFVVKAVMGKPIPPNKLKVGAFGLISPQLEQLMGGIKLTSSWGMTETVIHATRNQFDQFYPQGTMGRPTPGYQMIVVDPETGRMCEPGENGELYVRGVRGIQLFLEYFDNAEANAKAFTEDGWFKTGDRVIMSPDGFFFFQDRDKDALKVGGENVSAKEVEDACRQVGGITDVAIVGQEHDFLGQVAVAFVIPAPNAPEDLGEKIIAHCKTQLAEFKCPKAVYLVDEFPRATLDKVAKNKLRELADSYVKQ
jgi:crotonobetaine/carnitine-CoA ligase